MATGGEHVKAAAPATGEETPLRKSEQGADTELEAPSGWTKKLNPIQVEKFEVIFVAPTGEEIKTKRALTQYLKAQPGGPTLSEFNWGTGNTPRRSSWLSEKVKATESPEDEKPKPAKRGRSSSSKKDKKGKQEDAEEALAESGDQVDAEEAKGTDLEIKDADNAQEEKEGAASYQEEKKESDTAQGEKRDVLMVDAAEKTEESQVQTISLELPQGADAAGKTEDAIVNTEVSVLYEGADAAGKTEEAKVNLEVSELPKGADVAGKMEDAEITVVLELPKGADAGEKTEEAEGSADFSVLPSDVSTPVSENQGDGKRAESELAPLEGEKTENGPAIESTGPPLVEKKEEAGSTIINPVKPPAQICPASIQYVSNTSHTPTSSHLLTPPLPDEMIEEIFLCFSPDKAAALVRASLTSKTWIRIISSKRFRHRYVNIHGTPPLLGFFYCWPEYYEPKGEDTVNPFLSISHFNARIPDSEKEIILQYTVLDCRHGRVLAADPYVNPIKFLIWDPMTGRGSSLVAPREYSSQHATVICAVSGCDHLSCNKGNSQVVLVGIDHVGNVGVAASAYVFSTETGKWSDQSAVLELPSYSEATVIQNPPILLDEKLYFAIQYDEDDLEDDEDDVHILMYDLRSHCLSLIDAPQRDSISRNDFILLAMENGNLGFAELGWSSIELWSWQMGPEGAPGWTESTIVEHRNILPMQNRHYGKIEILGSVEGHGIVFLSTDLGIFKFNLNSQKFEKIWKREGFYILFPYFSFYKLEDESVLSDLNKNIIQARMVNELTQAQLAQMINEELRVVEEYEPGKAIPNQQIIGKLKESLGTKL